MSTSVEFPNNCVTNVHVLHDYAEIAYIVCTHAIPPNSENATDTNSPEKVLNRLLNAEKQFRQHSILVALDADKLELFTFYRKVDVVKDQHTILKKFGLVCRLNSCMISAKGAARVLELLKPESSRIYRLFSSAVLSSIQILPKGNGSALSVGIRTHLVPLSGELNSYPGAVVASSPEWQINRVNLQVIPTGQLILTAQTARETTLNLFSDLQRDQGLTHPQLNSLLYLMPTGQIARFSGGKVGSKGELSDALKAAARDDVYETKIALAKISTVAEWLKRKHPTTSATTTETTRWIEVEIPLLELKEGLSSASEKVLVWRSLMWPSNLIFVFQRAGELRVSQDASASDTDPLKFALDWYNGSAERSGKLALAQAKKDVKDEPDDEPAFSEEAHFEDHFTPQIFGPPVFPSSQTVYPTPPEATMAHQTPGMLSMDGLAPTPAPIAHLNHRDSEPFFDQEMPDIQNEQPEQIATGFYDEDLFEEMPDDKFEPNAEADEPNWDFFDEPGFVTSDGVKDLQDQSVSQEPSGARLNAPGEESNAKEGDNDDDDGTKFPELIGLPQKDQSIDVTDIIGMVNTTPENIGSVYVNDYDVSPMAVHQNGYVGETVLQQNEPKDSPREESQSGQEDRPHRFLASRRKSSIFEAVSPAIKHDNRDSRYSKLGKFWFDHDATTRAKETPNALPGSKKRPSSSSSEESIASNSGSSDVSMSREATNLYSPKRTWTEYRPESPNNEQAEVVDVNFGQVEIDTNRVLTVISAASGEDPFLVHVAPLARPSRRLLYNGQKTLMVAQILVDQTSQASLLRHERSLQLQHRINHVPVELSMDHSGAKAPLNHATLAELTAIPPRTTVKVNSLGSRLLCLKRSDSDIVAKQSILPFWDIVGLQPYNEPKDIAAFCIHPNSSNVAEGCLTFLNRLADTYASCNLGTHSTGRIAGLTNDGLLAWLPHSTSVPTLRQLCQRFGSSVGNSNIAIGSTIVIYMISPTKDLSQYREICHAFTILFDAFVDNSEGLKNNLELVLQIIPIDLVASPDTLVVPEQDTYLELALEVYNRVPMRQSETMAASCGSATILEKHPIRDPVFELTTAVVSPSSRDGPCLHLAYSYSADKRWLTAAWSDECGLVAFTMSYCLGTTSGEKTHSKREVFRSIWDTSNDIMSRSRVRWRLVVAYPGFYEVEDAGEWQQLISQAIEDRKLLSRLILLSVDLNPEILVEPSSTIQKIGQQPTIPQVVNASGTPVTTPQANTTSPDQVVAATPTSAGAMHANVTSPSEPGLESGQDPEAVLVDPSDQSWAVLLAFGLNQSSNLFDIRPAGASGLLVKRIGSKEDNKSLRLLGVNLVAAPRSQPTSLSLSEREAMLQEILYQYRGLTTLAISRGAINKASDCVPWHIATAVKGSKVLGEVM